MGPNIWNLLEMSFIPTCLFPTSLYSLLFINTLAKLMGGLSIHCRSFRLVFKSTEHPRSFRHPWPLISRNKRLKRVKLPYFGVRPFYIRCRSSYKTNAMKQKKYAGGPPLWQPRFVKEKVGATYIEVSFMLLYS